MAKYKDYGLEGVSSPSKLEKAEVLSADRTEFELRTQEAQPSSNRILMMLQIKIM